MKILCYIEILLHNTTKRLHIKFTLSSEVTMSDYNSIGKIDIVIYDFDQK